MIRRRLFSIAALLSVLVGFARAQDFSSSPYDQLPANGDFASGEAAGPQATSPQLFEGPQGSAAAGPEAVSTDSFAAVPGGATTAQWLEGVNVADGVGPPPARRRWTAGMELALLTPDYSNDVFTLYPSGSMAAPRGYLEWQSPDGVAARLRGWGFSGDSYAQRESLLSSSFYNDYVHLSAWRIDYDALWRWRIPRASVRAGVGFSVANLTLDEALSTLLHRAGNYRQNQGDYIGVGKTRQTAAGPSVLFELTTPFRERPHSSWAGVFRGRSAVMIGSWKSPDRDGRQSGGASMVVHELAGGFEYRRRLKRAELDLHVLGEYQAWDTTLVDNFALTGITVGGGLSW
jgi:hypothetical protein